MFELIFVLKSMQQSHQERLVQLTTSGGQYYRYAIDTFDIWIQFHSIDIGNETQKLFDQYICSECAKKVRNTRPNIQQ